MSKSMGIIGSGEAARHLVRLFARSDKIKVHFVIETDHDRSAISLAQKLNIPIGREVESLIRQNEPDFIIDTVGNEQLLDQVFAVRNHAKILTHDVSGLFAEVLSERQAQLGASLHQDLTDLKGKISNNTSEILKTSHSINKISNELEVLAINAGIQASRAGSFGKGFSVVAGEVKITARVARELSGDIDEVVSEISSLATDIEKSLAKAH
ncbi:MAG: hypothetical protein HQL52_08545 [Magnetococcales bacterium]|nr:hypothetical protein [Magnetococcales bacterium]